MSELTVSPRPSLEVTVHHNRAARTFEAHVKADIAGVIVYELSAGRAVLTHTIVEPEFRRRGVGSELVHVTLETLRNEGTRVTNYCGFVRDYIAAHPEYRSVINTAYPGLPPL